MQVRGEAAVIEEQLKEYAKQKPEDRRVGSGVASGGCIVVLGRYSVKQLTVPSVH